MSRVESRPKLLRDIESPIASENVKAGTIGRPNLVLNTWQFENLEISDEACRNKPDWFAFVNVCLKCKLAVCDLAGCWGSLAFQHPNVCHGHSQTPTTADGGDALSERVHELATKRLGEMYSQIDDALVSYLYDRLAEEHRRRDRQDAADCIFRYWRVQ